MCKLLDKTIIRYHAGTLLTTTHPTKITVAGYGGTLDLEVKRYDQHPEGQCNGIKCKMSMAVCNLGAIQ